jgi:hypothetical protein
LLDEICMESLGAAGAGRQTLRMTANATLAAISTA